MVEFKKEKVPNFFHYSSTNATFLIFYLCFLKYSLYLIIVGNIFWKGQKSDIWTNPYGYLHLHTHDQICIMNFGNLSKRVDEFILRRLHKMLFYFSSDWSSFDRNVCKFLLKSPKPAKTKPKDLLWI